MKTKYLKRSACAAAIAVSLFSGGNVAFAENGSGQPDNILTKAPAIQGGREFRSEAVLYRDLNLARPAGVRALYRRIDVAAKSVCSPQPDARDMVMRRDWQQCYDRALDKAVASAEFPALNRYHLVQTGRMGEEETQVTQAH
jgi:UrcA family protein